MIFVNYPGHFVAVVLLMFSGALVFLAFRSPELQKAKLRPYRPLLMLLQKVQQDTNQFLGAQTPSVQEFLKNMFTAEVPKPEHVEPPATLHLT